MRRDVLFYKLFKRFPALFFELIGQPVAIARHYRFDSVEVKEPTFRIDGVFLPLEAAPSKTIFFTEVQVRKDESLYDRCFAESMQYLHRNPVYDDWYGVIIFRSRNTEPKNQHLHRSLLNGSQVKRIYLNELHQSNPSLGIRTILLTLATKKQMPTQAKQLIREIEQTEQTDLPREEIIDTIATIVMYKFSKLSQREIQNMLGFNVEEEPRALRELKENISRKSESRLIVKMLTRKLGQVDSPLLEEIQRLSTEQLETLAEALLDFQSNDDLSTWLQQR
jgi:predicted transposase YdaD